MDEPVASQLTPGWMRGKGMLPWGWAVERLEAERNYWVVSVRRDGHPQARPVWGLWTDHGLFLSVGHGGLQRTEPRTSTTPITVHVDSAVDVVIVEGLLDRVAPYPSPEVRHEATLEIEPAVKRSVIERYNAKYDWNFELDGEGLNFLVRPRIVYGWHAPREVEAATKWTFPTRA